MAKPTKAQRAEALRVLAYWRELGVPFWVTSGGAWRLTGGLVGKDRGVSPMNRSSVCLSYAAKGGSVADAKKMQELMTR